MSTSMGYASLQRHIPRHWFTEIHHDASMPSGATTILQLLYNGCDVTIVPRNNPWFQPSNEEQM